VNHFIFQGSGNDWWTSWRIATWTSKQWTVSATPDDIYAPEVMWLSAYRELPARAQQ